jgi:hypothetical protein
MKRVLVLGKVPQNEERIADYKAINQMVDDYGYEIISDPIEYGEVQSFGDYGDLFAGVGDADIIIADVSDGSIEMGMQLKEADYQNKQIIALVRDNVEVPHVIESLPTIAEIVVYHNIDDVKESLLRNFAIVE